MTDSQATQTQNKTQLKGETYTLLLSIIEAHFPIFAFFTVAALGALHAYFYSLVVAAVFLVFWFVIRGRFVELKRTAAYKNLALTSLFITSLFSLIFLALQTTSPSHVAIILFLQVLFSYLFLGRKPGEVLDKNHLIGVVLMTFGAIIILFPNKFTLNLGDGLALLAAIIAPFANLYQKRARSFVSSETILMVRTLIALPFIYLLAFYFESTPSWQMIQTQWLWILLTGGLVFFISKMLWVEALHLLPITKVNALYAFSPLLTILLAYWYLDDVPTWAQILGGVPIVLGSYFITQKQLPIKR
ncbi:DMT family transporter [Hydrogenovibrio sp. 3SP14C1]|uniref:DMT family transporter n=1 Tax=Hydrogenovibrio sp. 3SP14C1 TaxID=3038774 RepID=UPI002416F766|nr:DMT family transporter [Hydrogenovibrio sp. 3SP14C1]MDG4812172.1 DMT family transporter [Hydrogenovibrio sp. 3SP14C1]